MSEAKVSCKEKVYRPGHRYPIQCSRPAKDGCDGYCAHHYPPTVCTRRAALEQKWADERAVRAAAWQEQKSAAEQLAHKAACFDDLLAALKSLRNEVVGQLGIAREEIRAAISTTNLKCLERRVEGAETAIEKAEGRS